MKSCALQVALLAIALIAPAKSTAGAMDKVFQMLADLEAKILAQGMAAKVTFEKFSKNCKSQSTEYGFEIKTIKAQIEEFSATMTKETSTITKSSSEIETLSGSISALEQDLAAAIKARKAEAADFAKEEKELLETIATIERAIAVLSGEPPPPRPTPAPSVDPTVSIMPIVGGPDTIPPHLRPTVRPIVGGPETIPPHLRPMVGGPDTIPPHLRASASMLQIQNAQNLVQALSAMVQASMLTQADTSRLTALIQGSQQTEDGDEDLDAGAPAGAVYESRSGGIIEVLEGLLDKAQAQLDEARKAEQTSIHNFQMLVQSLKDEIKYSSEDMRKTKLTIHTSKETFSVSKGDLSVTKKDLAATLALLKELEHGCMTAAEEYEEETKSRAEELAAVRKATQILKDATSFVDKGASGAISFIQERRAKVALSSDLANVKAVRLVRDLARKQHSAALSQLASRMESTTRMSAATGADPFAKVQGMIITMIKKLEEEADAEEDHKAYCDKELGETKAKKDASTSDIKAMTVSLDQMKAHVLKLKDEVAELERELAASSKAAAEAGIIRQEEKAEYLKNVAEYSKGLEGVKLALKVLKEYYAKETPSEPTVSIMPVIEDPSVDPIVGGPDTIPPHLRTTPTPSVDPTVSIMPVIEDPSVDPIVGGPETIPPHLRPMVGGPETIPPHLRPMVGGPETIPPHLRDAASMLQTSPDNSGAASGIISLLEVVESDLSKGLVEFEQVEQTAAAEYEEMMKDLKVRTASKQQDVKYKTKEAASLEKKIADLEGDLGNAETELDAILDYLDKLNKECAPKVEPYEKRKASREAEIAGLKEALTILEGETVLLQQKVRRRSLRGLHAHRL